MALSYPLGLVFRPSSSYKGKQQIIKQNFICFKCNVNAKHNNAI